MGMGESAAFTRAHGKTDRPHLGPRILRRPAQVRGQTKTVRTTHERQQQDIQADDSAINRKADAPANSKHPGASAVSSAIRRTLQSPIPQTESYKMKPKLILLACA